MQPEQRYTRECEPSSCVTTKSSNQSYQAVTNLLILTGSSLPGGEMGHWQICTDLGQPLWDLRKAAEIQSDFS
eukprot:976558-Rhodomonas_salina.1